MRTINLFACVVREVPLINLFAACFVYALVRICWQCRQQSLSIQEDYAPSCRPSPRLAFSLKCQFIVALLSHQVLVVSHNGG